MIALFVLAVQPTPAPSFSRSVLPILRTACLGCHSTQQPAGGIALGSFAELMKGGRHGAAIVPGKASQSRLVKMLTGEIKPIMPPGAGLKAADIDVIRRWVDAGAKLDAAPIEIKVSAPKAAPVAPTGPVVVTKAIGALKSVAAPVHSLAYSPDGKWLAVGTYQNVLLCDPVSRKVVTTWNGHADTVRALAFSPDGKTLVAAGGTSGAQGEVRLWGVAEGKELRHFGEDHTDTVNAVAFSPDGKTLVSASSDKFLKVWDPATGKLLQTLRDHADAVLGVAFHPNGKYLASCGSDKSVKVWDTTAWRRIYSVGAHEEPVTGVAFGAQGAQLVSISTDRLAKQWTFGPESSGHIRNLGGHGQSVWNVAISADGQLAATASGDKTVKLWRLSDGANIATLSGAKDWVYATALSPDKKHLAEGTWDGQVFLWTLEPQQTLEGSFSTLPGGK